MSLAELQTLFWDAMRAPEAGLAVHVVGTERMSAAARVAVYRRAYWLRQLEALADEFPRLLGRWGRERFDAVVRQYLLAHPSEDPRLEWIGRHVEGFLRGHEDESVRAAADLAAFEWAETEAVLAPDPPAIATLLSVPPVAFAGCRLELVPSLRLLSLATDPLVDAGAEAAPATFAVWRRGFSLQYRRIAPDEWAAALEARGGAEIAVVCGAFADAPDPPGRAHAVLRAWLTQEWVGRIVCPRAEGGP